MGSLYTHIVMTNRGLTPCATGGFGGVSHVAGADGHQVGSAAKRDPDHKVTRYVLKPGQRAVATLQEPEPENYPKARCLPVRSTGLRIYPPNETHSTFVSRPAKVCSKKSVQIFLQPYVKKG